MQKQTSATHVTRHHSSQITSFSKCIAPPSSGQLSPNSVAGASRQSLPRSPGGIHAKSQERCLPGYSVSPRLCGPWAPGRPGRLCWEGGSCDAVGKSATASNEMVSTHRPGMQASVSLFSCSPQTFSVISTQKWMHTSAPHPPTPRQKSPKEKISEKM